MLAPTQHSTAHSSSSLRFYRPISHLLKPNSTHPSILLLLLLRRSLRHFLPPFNPFLFPLFSQIFRVSKSPNSSSNQSMASISIPCPKCYPIFTSSSRNPPTQQPRLAAFAASLKGPKQRHFPVLKAQAREVALENTSNSSPLAPTKSKKELSNGVAAEGSTDQSVVPESVITAFMAEVADLVKLVDSRDITELQLKQKDCELIIRKQEALQPAPTAPVVMMQPSLQAMYAPPPPAPTAVPPPRPAAPSPAASAPALPFPAKGGKSSHPPLKCPMAGTFYRSPAPGEPPFIKVGDKVKKGQVVCIIEAMKLMNEIEADQSGTVVDIIAEDGKPVSVDTPLLVIEP